MTEVETEICMGRICFQKHVDYEKDNNPFDWRIYRIEDDRTLTLIDQGFRHQHMVRLAKQLVEKVLR